MAAQCRTSTKGETRVKRPRRVMSLGKKIEILDMLANGESAASVGRLLGVNESTIRTIKKSEEAIRLSVARGAPKSAKVISGQRDRYIEKVEKVLSVWLGDQVQKKIPLTSAVICENAKRLYRHFIEMSGGGNVGKIKFQAGKDWFKNFKKRYGLQNIKFDGDTNDTMIYVRLKEMGDVSEQVLNVDDSGVSCVPSRTFVLKYTTGFEVMQNLKDETLTDPQSPEMEELLEPHVELIEGESQVESSEESSRGEFTKPYEEDLDMVVESSNDNENKGTVDRSKITLDNLNEGLCLASSLAKHFTDIDPNAERSLNFRQRLEELMRPYRDMQEDLQSKLS